ncbi:MAG: M64 family metallopeptidase [Acidobacteriota bacterium]|nr:M64 family metallopeptidase [Acidobacteriota bacterium]
MKALVITLLVLGLPLLAGDRFQQVDLFLGAVDTQLTLTPLPVDHRPPENLEPGPGRLTVAAYDHLGNLLARQTVNDPRILRGEFFDQNGHIIESHRVVRDRALLQVVLPTDLSIARLDILEPSVFGDALAFSLLQSVPFLPQRMPHERKLGKTETVEVTTLMDNGAYSDRLDLVFISEGYTAEQMSDFVDDVEDAMRDFFAIEPFETFEGFFNVTTIKLVSEESGADHPSDGIFVDTALDATYECAGIDRLICLDDVRAVKLVNTLVHPDADDLVVVLVNDPEYGGSGGMVAVTSTDSSMPETIIHEAGHTLGLLADEYVEPLLCDPAEPEEPNATTFTFIPLVKWAHWFDGPVLTPTPESFGSMPGLYEGGNYCPADMYRPTATSAMRALGEPFYAVNEEVLVRRIYSFASPIDSYRPLKTTLLVTEPKMTFSVTPMPGHVMSTIWILNDTLVGSGDIYELLTSDLAPGTNYLRAETVDATPKVRLDPEALLEDAVTWKLIVE